MKLRVCFVALLGGLMIFTLTACNRDRNGETPNCGDDHPMRDWVTSPEWAFEFPNDSFPPEISFVTEYAVYSPDTESITAILTNVATNSEYVLFRYIEGFDIVRKYGAGWVHVPQIKGFGRVYLDLRTSQRIGETNTYTIINDCFTDDSQGSHLYTHGYRFSSGGTYRIITKASLVYGRHEAWSGYVWAEFEIG